MHGRYILDGHRPVECEDLMEWCQWMQTANRHVGDTTIGCARVSTVFLGLDHRFGPGAPVLFETLIFGGERDGDGFRYETWEQAEAGHAKFVAELREAMSTTPDPARAEALAIWDRASHHEPILCSLCPTVNGVRPVATVRAWVVISGPHALVRTARQYALCEPCHREARERGDLVPGAEVTVQP